MTRKLFGLLVLITFLMANLSAQRNSPRYDEDEEFVYDPRYEDGYIEGQDTEESTVAQSDSTGLLGDNFNLKGALDLFKKSSSPEDFERRLNVKGSYVNNLDLNEDGKVDFIRVIDNTQEAIHAIVMRIYVNRSEQQDIAVIQIEKTGDQQATLQIVGDEDLFGPNVIVEPFGETAANLDPNGGGPDGGAIVLKTTDFNCWFWPTVQFIFDVSYVVYASPYRWDYYPSYYSPWDPFPWRYHYHQGSMYWDLYQGVTIHRIIRAHQFYVARRIRSAIIRNRIKHHFIGNRPSPMRPGGVHRPNGPSRPPGFGNHKPRPGQPGFRPGDHARPNRPNKPTGVKPGQPGFRPGNNTRPAPNKQPNGSYTRPAPNKRPNSSYTRPAPNKRPNSSYTRPSRPNKRPNSSYTRPSRPNKRPNSSYTRPSRPNPSVRPNRPNYRPRPSTRPATRPSTRPSYRPSTRPAKRPTARPSRGPAKKGRN